MGREEDRLAARLLLEDDLLQHVLVDRVEAAEGFVQDQQLRIVEHRGDELHFLLHPLRQRLHLLGRPFAEAEPLQPFLGAGAGQGSPDAADLAEEDELVEDLHLLVDAALLGQVADPAAAVEVGWAAEELHGAAVGQQDAHHHADRGRLARAVGAQQAVDRAGLDLQVEVVDRGVGAERLADAGEAYNGSVLSHAGLLPFAGARRG